MEEATTTTNEHQLYKVAAAGNRKQLQALLAAGDIDVNAADDESMEELADACPDVDIFAITALGAAAEWGHAGCVADLLAAGAEVDGEGDGNEGKTPLWVATLAKRYTCMALLIKAGADVNATGYDWDHMGSCLHYAAWRCDIKAVTMLLEAGADPDGEKAGQHDQTPLHITSDPTILCMLLEAGATPIVQLDNEVLNGRASEDDVIGTPLHSTVLRGHEACVALLATLPGALTTTSPFEGGEATALQLAVAEGKDASVRILQSEARWQRRRPLALVREQRRAVRDAKMAHKEENEGGNKSSAAQPARKRREV